MLINKYTTIHINPLYFRLVNLIMTITNLTVNDMVNENQFSTKSNSARPSYCILITLEITQYAFLVFSYYIPIDDIKPN